MSTVFPRTTATCSSLICNRGAQSPSLAPSSQMQEGTKALGDVQDLPPTVTARFKEVRACVAWPPKDVCVLAPKPVTM